MTLLTLGAIAIAFSAAAQNRQSPPPSTSAPVSPQTQVAQGEDAEFLLDALRSSKAEMQMGELAQQRSKNAAVQQFGEKLRADHAKAADEIETLLEPLNMNVPAEPSTEQQSHHAALAKLSGEEFDRRSCRSWSRRTARRSRSTRRRLTRIRINRSRISRRSSCRRCGSTSQRRSRSTSNFERPVGLRRAPR